jgi:transcriptional regulator
MKINLERMIIVDKEKREILEKQIRVLKDEGLTNSEIAKRLGITITKIKMIMVKEEA